MEKLDRANAYIYVGSKKVLKTFEAELESLGEKVCLQNKIKARYTCGLKYLNDGQVFCWTRVSTQPSASDNAFYMSHVISILAAELDEKKSDAQSRRQEDKDAYIEAHKVDLTGVVLSHVKHPTSGHPISGERTLPDGTVRLEFYSEDGILMSSMDQVPASVSAERIKNFDGELRVKDASQRGVRITNHFDKDQHFQFFDHDGTLLFDSENPSIGEVATESPLERLTALQKELGYERGDISAVAMLGLVGEAGEVLNEVQYNSDSPYSEYIVNFAIQACENLDELKKSVRDGLVKPVMEVKAGADELFVKELADTLYYLNILALNQGLTIEDLAQVSHDKVRDKMNTPTGSSEQQRPVTAEGLYPVGYTLDADKSAVVRNDEGPYEKFKKSPDFNKPHSDFSETPVDWEANKVQPDEFIKHGDLFDHIGLNNKPKLIHYSTNSLNLIPYCDSKEENPKCLVGTTNGVTCPVCLSMLPF